MASLLLTIPPMAQEIERKFLVIGITWKAAATSVRICQGYLSRDQDRTVRVRIEDERGVLTVKGPARGITRLEFDCAIPLADARTMLDVLCLPPLIEKTRYTLRVGGHRWQIDEFHADNGGLIVAEIELSAEDEDFERPAWLGAEVSHDPRYFNASLSQHPYRRWQTPPSTL